MLLRFLLVATLAVCVLGRSTTFSNFSDTLDPYDEYSQIVATEYCKATRAEDKVPEVKSSIKTFAKCLTSLYDTETISRDLKEARTTGKYVAVIRTYCTKAPQLKDCVRDLVKGATPCLPPGVVDTSINSTDTMIDFVCDNDAARVTSFVKEGGAQCIQEKQLDLVSCQHKMEYNVTKLMYGIGVAGTLAMSEKERCRITDQGLMCLVNVLKGCSNPTPGNMAQEFRDVYLESMSCPEESGVTEVVGASVVNKEMEQLKKKKLELEIRIAELEMWNRENQLHVLHTDLTSDIKSSL